MMELLQLKYFLKTAQAGSITQAAKDLHIAQPSLSKTIHRLEDQVGVRLFDRRGKHIYVNEAGRKFYQRVETILHELDNAVQEARDTTCEADKHLVLGTATAKLLPETIRDYLMTHPDVHFRLLQVMDHQQLWHKLQTGDIDLCISSLEPKEKDFCSFPLMTEKIYLVVSRRHPLAGRKAISLEEVTDQPLIHYTAECGLRDIIEEGYRRIQHTPQFTCECMTPEITCSLIEAGIGIGFLPASLAHADYARQLSWIAVTAPVMERTIWLSYNPAHYLSQAAVQFKDFVMEHFAPPGRQVTCQAGNP